MNISISSIYEQSHVPYSLTPEAAVVYSEEERFFPGKRIESRSYPLTLSAAQIALFCCLSEGDTPSRLMVTNTGDRLPFAFHSSSFSSK
ncbi:MAG TPA: hypothetical protein VK074_13495 [Fodinibius sp.]|nr:hypothetical protein [Fodinibius sp.]